MIREALVFTLHQIYLEFDLQYRNKCVLQCNFTDFLFVDIIGYLIDFFI